jgi:hypothetical protein
MTTWDGFQNARMNITYGFSETQPQVGNQYLLCECEEGVTARFSGATYIY